MKKIVSMVFLLLMLLLPALSFGGQWKGVDETVVEKIAGEHGRAASLPLINTGKGDMLLFVFLVAGVAGGFVLGYTYRVLFAEKRPTGGTQ